MKHPAPRFSAWMSMLAAFIVAFNVSTASSQPVQPGGQRPAGDEDSLDGGNLFVQKRERTRDLKTARELIENKNYTLAVKLLQVKLVNAEDDSFFFPDVEKKTKFLSHKAEAMRMLESLPPAGQRVYELQYGLKAKRDLTEAIAAGKFSEVERIARLYFHTQAGYEATYLLASHQLDSGKALSAALNFERLRRLARKEVRRDLEPMLSLKTAVAWGRAGIPKISIDTLVEFKRFTNGGSITLGNKKVTIFERDEDALQWLVTSLGRQRGFTELGKEQWTQFRGDPSRTAQSAPSSPVWDSQWSVDTIRETGFAPREDRKALEEVASDVKKLVQLRKQENKDALMVPGFHPLIVGDMAVFRSLRNIWAVNTRTGELAWRTFIKNEVYQRLADLYGAKAAKNGAPNGRLINQPNRNSKGRQLSEMQMFLDQWLWRDLNAGTLSSDGEFIYSVEGLDFYNPTKRYYNRTTRSYFANLTKYNQLMAVHAKTGKLAWYIGGEADTNDPLAGYFFLGPPLALGGQLFCLADKNGEIQLVVIGLKREMKLKEAVGIKGGKEMVQVVEPKVLWKQSLISPDEGITRYPLRRMAGLTPSYSGGVLVCPTTAGAVVAVDPARRLLLWGYRYQQNTETGTARNRGLSSRRYPTMNPYDSENRWLDAGVTMAEGRVILTPRDSNELHCVNLVDGNLIWKRRRGEMLYVAAVHDGNLVLGGQSQMQAFQLSSGLPAWKQSTPLPMPSGRGFQTKSSYHLPLTTAEIATIDLSTGRVLARTRTRSGMVPGNLVSANGLIVSQSIDRVMGFRPLSELKAEITARLKANPKDAEALALRGEMRLRAGQEEEGLQDLRASIAAKPTERAKSLVGSVLLEGLRLDFAKFRKHKDELDKLITEPEQQARYRRILAAGLHEVGEHKAAFREYVKLAGLNTDSWKDERVSGVLTVRGDRWLKSRLSKLFASATPADRKELMKEIEGQFAAVRKQAGTDALRRFVRAFSDLPIAESARRELAGRMAADESLRLEMLLERLKTSSDPKIAGYATARLATLFLDQEKFEAAADQIELLEGKFAAVVCQHEKTGRQIATNLKAAKPQVVKAARDRAPWPKRRFLASSSRSGSGSTTNYYSLDFDGGREPYYRGWSFAISSSNRQLIARDANGIQRWQIPTQKSGRRYSYFSYYGNTVRTRGHLLVVTVGDRFLVIDGLAQPPKVLWERNLFEETLNQTVNRGVRVQRIQVGGRARMVVFDPNGDPLGQIGPVTNDMIVYQIGKTVYAADPVDGDVLWERSALERGSRIFGDDDYVFVVAPGSTTALVLRGSDGERLGERPVAQAKGAQTTRGRFELRWNASGQKQVLSWYDVWKEKSAWEKQFEGGSKLALVEGDEVAVVEPRKGRLHVLNLKTGKPSAEVTIERDTNLQYFVIRRSRERYIMLSYSPEAAPANRNVFNVQGINYTSPLVEGRVYGIDRRTGKKIWEAYAENQAIDENQPNGLPVVVLASKRYERPMVGGRIGAYRYMLSVTVLDARTGRQVLHVDAPERRIPTSLGLTINQDEKTIGMKFYSTSIKLRLSDKPLGKPNTRTEVPKREAKPKPANKANAAAKRLGNVPRRPPVKVKIVVPRK